MFKFEFIGFDNLGEEKSITLEANSKRDLPPRLQVIFDTHASQTGTEANHLIIYTSKVLEK